MLRCPGYTRRQTTSAKFRFLPTPPSYIQYCRHEHAVAGRIELLSIHCTTNTVFGCPLPRPHSTVPQTDQDLHNVTMKTPWTRLIRFVASDGRTLYGEPILPVSQPDFDIGDTTEQTGLKARVIAVGADGLFGGGAEPNGVVLNGRLS